MTDFTIFTLDNGLRVVHHYDPEPSHVCLNLLYNVGARDESPRLTGMAHLFEHLMFGGSRNVDSFDYHLEMAGGTNNAWTTNDFTNFYDIIPLANVETAFWAESDRMLEPSLTPESLETQRSVVIEEFKQTCLNKPYGDTGHLLRGLLYKTHPYRIPTIGKEPGHISRVTLADAKDFFYSHYAPNNAVLAIAGPLTLDETERLALKWFGPIPRREIAPRLYAPEAEITEPRQLEIKAKVPQTRIHIAFPMDAYLHPDYRVADLITDILASGNSARFTRELVMGTDLFTSADASISGSEEPGFLLISGSLRRDDQTSVEAAERALWEQIDRIASCEVDQRELQRALNRFESNLTFSQLNYVAIARELAKATIHGEDINSIVPAYRSVTTADILRVASRLLRRNRSCTLIYRPE